MENEVKDNNKYLLFDDKGLIIEKDEAFNDNIVGDICSILYKGKKISNENEVLISVQFEKGNLVLSNDSSKKLSVCSLTNKN